MILIGAILFSLVFRGLEGEEFIHKLLVELPNDKMLTLIIVLIIMFLLGFILDFIEITFIVIPLIGPALFTLGFDPLWLGILIALVLQTSFITPPFGFSLFYLRGVLPVSCIRKCGRCLHWLIHIQCSRCLQLRLLRWFPRCARNGCQHRCRCGWMYRRFGGEL